MLTRGKTALVAAWLAALLAVLACSGGTPAAEPQAPTQPAPAQQPTPEPAAPAAMPEGPKPGGILTLPLRRDPPGAWDITRVTQRYDLNTAGAPLWGYGNLVRECREDIYEICPGLAESWEHNQDFTQWTFKIRDGVSWHDGTPFTAEDVKFWLELISFGVKVGEKQRLPAWWRKEFGDIQQVDALPAGQLRITLSEPSPVYLNLISSPFWNFAIPRHLAQPKIQEGLVDVTPQDVGWVGTGPFKMLLYEKGSRVQERRFDGYWERDDDGRTLPYVDGIDFAVMADAQAMDAAIRAGRLDGGARVGGFVLSQERKTAYERDLGDEIWFAEIKGGGGLSLGLNFNLLKEGPIQDVRVRRAISLWVDRQASIDAYQGSLGYVATIFSPDNPYTSPEYKTWPGFDPNTRERDRAEAKRLLAEAGYAGGVRLTTPCQSSYSDRCQFFQAQLKDLGVDLDFRILDPAAWSAANLATSDDLFQAPAYPSRIPEGQESALTRYSISPGAVVKHEDARVPEFMDRIKGSTSFEERVRIWRELEDYMILEHVYLAPISSRVSLTPYRTYVKGLPVPAENTQSLLDFATVWLDK